MSRSGFKITRCGEDHEAPGRSGDSNVPAWMKSIADNASQYVEKSAVTVVDQARERATVHDQIHAIMNGNRPVFSSVEEVVTDYQSKTGLNVYLEKIQTESSLKAAASHIVSASDEEDSEGSGEEKKKPEDEDPLIFSIIPGIESFIRDIVSGGSRSVPAILYELGSHFRNEGVEDREVDDPALAKFISSLLQDSETTGGVSNDVSTLGKGLFDNTEGDSSDDPFAILRTENINN